MKTLIYSGVALTLLTLGSCQNSEKQTADPKALSQKAIEIHDEIMPQISTFNKQGILIDSLLENLTTIKQNSPDLDTTNTRQELSSLKTDIDSATDKMMAWMKEYSLDNADVAYQEAEIERISALKAEFEKVSNDAAKSLTPFSK